MQIKQQGFTLIELLIVIVIISIIASVAALSININQSKRLEAFTNQLVNALTLAQQEALLRSATLGLTITKENYRFSEFRLANKGTWTPLTAGALRPHPIPKDMTLTLKIQDEVVKQTSKPQIIIAPSNDLIPFIILIGKKDSSPLFKVIGKANGEIKSEMINDEEN